MTKVMTRVEAGLSFGNVWLPDMRRYRPNTMRARTFNHCGHEVNEITICTWLDAVGFDSWFNGLPDEAREGFVVSDKPTSSDADNFVSGIAPHYYWQGILLHQWLIIWNAVYYAAPRESFSLTAALTKAVERKSSWVVTEDMS